MLSRSAKHLYWLARYIERAENIARMIDVNLELILDFPDDHSLSWKPLIDTLDINDLFESKYKKYNENNVLNFLFEDIKNLSSLNNCLEMSKYNIETIKDDLPKTANIGLNHLYDHVLGQKISKVHQRRKLQHITNIVSMTQNFFGAINDNLSRGYEFEFGRTFSLGSGDLTLSFGRDDVNAEFSDGHNVPRINPARNIYSLSYVENDWVFKLSLKDVEKQNDIGEGESVTDSYQMLNTRLTKTFNLNGPGELKVSIFGSNLLDEVARNHSSFVKKQPGAGRE